jgi:DNA-binding transcriptional MerR regulator
MKRGGGRRYYRPEDMELLRGIRALLHAEGYTIRGVQKILREHGVDQVKAAARRKPTPEAVTLPAPVARKRGRKPIAGRAPSASAQPPSGPPAAVPSPTRDANVLVFSAIRELQIARAILLGQPLNQVGAGAPAELKKARAGRT